MKASEQSEREGESSVPLGGMKGATRAPVMDPLCEYHAEMCQVFSNAMRLMILQILREREMSVARIAGRLKAPLGTVSPHLLMMKRRRVLVSRREKNQIFYRIANPKILKAFDLIRAILCEQMKKEGGLVRA